MSMDESAKGLVINEAIRKLDDQVRCAICREKLKQPKLLNCFHIFCEGCLRNLVASDRGLNRGLRTLFCPICRQSTLLPPDTNVSNLQSAFHIQQLFEIKEVLEKANGSTKVQCEKCTKGNPATSFCKDCGKFVCSVCADFHAEWEEYTSHEVVSMDQLQSDAYKRVPLKNVTHVCSKHNQELRLYCDTCKDLICHDCTVKLHQGHQYDLISDTFEGHKADITESVEPVKRQVTIVDDKLKKLDARRSEISERRNLVAARVHEKIQNFIEILKQREAALISQIDEVVDPKLNNLSTQRVDMESRRAKLDRCLSYVCDCLQSGSQGDIVKTKTTIVNTVESATADFNADALEPCEESNIGFMFSPTFTEACQCVGSVYSPVVDPENSYASGEGLEAAKSGENATVLVSTLDQHGRCFYGDIKERIQIEVVSEIGNERVRGSIDHLGDNRYKVDYRPTRNGKHQLCILIDGKPIKGSPFVVTVEQPIKELGTPIMTITGVKGPWGVTVNQMGEIIVVENAAHCVSIYSHAGEKLRSFGLKGNEQGQFNLPRGVAVDDEGNIFVADSVNHRIQKFTADGEFISEVGKYGTGPLDFGCPAGVAIHPVSKKVYVSDGINNRVQILNPDLTSHSMFTGAYDEHVKRYLRGLAFDSAHNVYVCHACKNTQVQIFTENGEHLRWIGNRVLNCPHDVGIDSNDHVYICDTNHDKICIFSTSGALLYSFGSSGNQPGQFDHPHGIAIDKHDVLYVSDHFNDRVQIF